MEILPIPTESFRVGFIGAGKMAESIARGVVASGVLPPNRISTAVHSNANRRAVFESFGVNVFSSSEDVVNESDVVIFCVNPQVVKSAITELRSKLSKKKLLVSVAAGIKLHDLQSWSGQDRFIRVMPNTPAAVGEAATVMSLGTAATEEDAVVVAKLFGSVGKILRADEKMFDAMETKKRKNAVGCDSGASVTCRNVVDSFSKFSNSGGIGSPRRIFLFCLAFRVVNALLIQTYFNPDEHWQSLEVAHRIVFGYGHLTWEWKRGIRSYLHPMVFVFLYKVLAVMRLDSPYIMSKAPRLLQSIISALGDLYLYKLSDALFGENVATWSLFCQMANWFIFFCLNRTFSNCLETVLTIMGLYYWPCIRNFSRDYSVNRKWALVIAALACAIRPTSAIIWLYVGLLELFLTPDKLKFIILEVVPIGSMVLGLTCMLDRLMYGSWVIVPLNFLKFNFLSSGGDYYGTHPWHWYFTQGFLVMLFTFTPYSITGMIKSKNQKLSPLILWVLAMYSILGHKEFRFVLPVLPIALIFSGYAFAEMGASGSSITKKKQVPKRNRITNWSPKLRLSVFFLLATNIPMAFYMSLFHQRGSEDAMNYLSEEADRGRAKNILFLMPCHSTPYYSTLHNNIPMRFLDCTPSEEKGVLDESDQFLMDPLGFASELARNWSNPPSHIVLFTSEETKLRDFMIQHSFKEVKSFFHAHFKVDRDFQAAVVIYAKDY